MSYSYEYNTYNGDVPEGMVGFIAVLYLLVFAIAIVSIIAEWKLFKKAGYNGWEAIVPFYNTYCLCDIVFGNGLLFLILFVPVVNGFFSLFLFFKMAEVYNKSAAFGIGLIFLSPIFLCLMAFDSNTYYNGPSVKARQMGGYGNYGAGGYGGYGAGSYGGVPNMTNDYQTYGSNNSGYQNNGFQAQGQPMQQNNGFQAQGQPMQQNNGFQAQGQSMQQNSNPFEKPGANNYYGNNSSYNGYNNQNGNGGF